MVGTLLAIEIWMAPLLFISRSLCYSVVHVSAMSNYVNGLQWVTSHVLRGNDRKKISSAH